MLTQTYCDKVNIQITQREDFIQIVHTTSALVNLTENYNA